MKFYDFTERELVEIEAALGHSMPRRRGALVEQAFPRPLGPRYIIRERLLDEIERELDRRRCNPLALEPYGPFTRVPG